jgi:LysM repeat protein
MLFFFCLFIVISSHAFTLRADAPSRYVVQSGDSIWGIANRYLAKPWEWKALWHANPQIKNPSRLYPGAVIVLSQRGNRPYLRVLSNGTIKLSPHVRPMPADDAIPPIPLMDIKPFLNGSLILDKNSLLHAPFIIAFMNEHMLGGQGDEVYVKNLCSADYILPAGLTVSYGIYRPCGKYYDSTHKRFLGYKAALISYAELVKGGDPATILITDIKQGVKLGDKVMPNTYPDFNLFFEPQAPSMPIHSSIIDVLGDFSLGAVGLVAVIDGGQDAGLRPGDVLGIYSRPVLVANSAYRYDKKPPCEPQCVKTPPERLGELMVFRTFTHTSMGLVVRSTRAIQIFDAVTNP